MLEGLPSDWETFCEIVDTRVTSDKAWEELILLLLKREADIREKCGIPEDTALYGKAGKKRRFGKKKGTRGGENDKGDEKDGVKFAGTCNGCGKSGHKKADCWLEEGNKAKRPKWWKGKEKDEAKKVTDGKSSTQMFAVRDIRNGDCVLATTTGDIQWIINSGCTRHITPHRSAFRTFQAIPKGQHAVDTTTGQRISTTGSGNVTMMVDSPQGETKIIVTDELYVTACEESLISVDQLAEKGVDVHFTKGKAMVTRGKETVCPIARSRNRLYIMDSGPHKPGETDRSHKVSEHSVDTCHQRFGHIDQDAIGKLPTMVTGMPTIKRTNRDCCESCLLRKMTRAPFKDATVRMTEPLQRVYMDLCGPMKVQSIGSNKYFLLVTNEHTRFCKIYFMRKKSEALDHFKTYVQSAKNEMGKIPLAIHTAGGGEFTSMAFKKYLDDNGIRAELTVPNTLQEDRISEVGNRIIVGRGNIMLQHTNTPRSYWAEAAVTAVQLSNVSLARRNGGAKTPHEMWTGNKPEVRHLKIWGCVAFMKALKPEDNKWDARVNRCMLVGYTQSTKIWKVYDPVKKRSFTSRDVVFYEEGSYYKDTDDGEKKGTEMMDLVNCPTRIEPIEETSQAEEEPRKEPTEESSRGQIRAIAREPAHEETQPDRTLSSIPSDAELLEIRTGPVTPGVAEPVYTHAEEHTPRVQQALDEFH